MPHHQLQCKRQPPRLTHCPTVQGAAPLSSVKRVRTAPCRGPSSTLWQHCRTCLRRAPRKPRRVCAGAKGSGGVCSAFNASEVTTYTYRTRGADWPDNRAWQCGPSSCPRGAPRAAAARGPHVAWVCRCNGTRQSPVEYPLPAGAPARFVACPARASGRASFSLSDTGAAQATYTPACPRPRACCSAARRSPRRACWCGRPQCASRALGRSAEAGGRALTGAARAAAEPAPVGGGDAGRL